MTNLVKSISTFQTLGLTDGLPPLLLRPQVMRRFIRRSRHRCDVGSLDMADARILKDVGATSVHPLSSSWIAQFMLMAAMR